jgi:hypothetical protein
MNFILKLTTEQHDIEFFVNKTKTGPSTDNKNNINNNNNIILYLFTLLLSSPKANYKVSTSKGANKRNI